MKKHTSFSHLVEQVRNELELYYLYSEGRCGFKSNFSAVVNAMFMGGPAQQRQNFDPYNDGMLSAIDVRRQIEKKLKKLSYKHLSILYSSFYPTNYPPSMTKYFNRYVGASIHTTLLEHKEIHQYCDLYFLGKLSDPKKEMLSEIKKLAALEFERAIMAYINLEKN